MLMSKISIDYDIFTNNVTQLKSNISNIDLKLTSEITETDINPFSSFSTLINELQSSVSEYKSLIQNDINKIQEVGDQIKESDEKTANINKN
ncbi:TIGR04197 family type VII secretion effector [Erwinia sp. CPCC 100877]|nr:TIGR04197 family type VII secretion effector [Erwinia sp. CPCC 100877]